MVSIVNTDQVTLVVLLYLTCMYPFSVSATAVPAPFFSCTDYHCDEGQTVTLTADQWHAVEALFSAVQSPTEEREQIRRAVALLETEVGRITGTWRDLAGNVAGAGQAGQLDCISESKNTTTYLALLQEQGLLRWHGVEERALRRPWIIGLHWTAVIRDRSTGQRFAVDSWYLDNGEPPYIHPIEKWLSGQPFNMGRGSDGRN